MEVGMTRRILVAAGLVAALAGGTAISYAQGPGGPGFGQGRGGPRGGAGMDAGLRGLDLTEAQREQVRAIMQSHRSERQSARKALADAHRQLAEATRGTNVDEALIRERSTAVANALAADAILRARIRSEVHALLTPEQQQQLQERRATMQKRMQDRQERSKQRLEQRQQRQRPPQ
jgi:periplasmic protein CpxP/Spy